MTAQQFIEHLRDMAVQDAGDWALLIQTEAINPQ